MAQPRVSICSLLPPLGADLLPGILELSGKCLQRNRPLCCCWPQGLKGPGIWPTLSHAVVPMVGPSVPHIRDTGEGR